MSIPYSLDIFVSVTFFKVMTNQKEYKEEKFDHKKLPGKEKLAAIVRQARGGMSVRDFASKVGVVHATISNLENCRGGTDSSTLNLIAPHTGYSSDELRAILEGREPPLSRNVYSAEQILPLVAELAEPEQIELIIATCRRLGTGDRDIVKKIMARLLNIL